MEVLEKIKVLLKSGFHNTDKDLLIEIYREVFFETIDIHCTQCIYAARLRLKRYLQNPEINTVMSKSGKYQFKKEFAGHKINSKNKKIGRGITSESLTDSVAEEMLKDDSLKHMIEEVKLAKKEEKEAAK
jgi:hypothetical protein